MSPLSRVCGLGCVSCEEALCKCCALGCSSRTPCLGRIPKQHEIANPGMLSKGQPCLAAKVSAADAATLRVAAVTQAPRRRRRRRKTTQRGTRTLRSDVLRVC